MAAVVHNFVLHVLDGETEINLQGQDGVQISPDSLNTPKLIGIVGGLPGMEIVIHNLSGAAIPVVDKSISASSVTSKIIMTGFGGNFSLPDNQLVWAIKVDPNDAGFPDAKRGWYLDSGGQEVFARAKTTVTTPDPVATDADPLAVLEQMSVSVTTIGGHVVIDARGGIEIQDGDAGYVQLFVDGAVSEAPQTIAYVSSQGTLDPNPSIKVVWSLCTLLTELSAGPHTFEVRRLATAGSLRFVGLDRILRVVEIPSA